MNLKFRDMKQEDKELLLKDLCARLPYGLKVLRYVERDNKIQQLMPELNLSITLVELFISNHEFIIKPYLRSMSSMTDEEKKIHDDLFDNPKLRLSFNAHNSSIYLDWLNSHHFDYRGLIEKGLAIAVTEYNNQYK